MMTDDEKLAMLTQLMEASYEPGDIPSYDTLSAYLALAEKTIVKKYSVMYKPEQIVKRTWKDLKHKNRDVSVYGAVAKGQALLVKLMPHRFVMWVWMKQQGLR